MQVEAVKKDPVVIEKVVERIVEKPIIVEKPVIVEKPIYVEKPTPV